MPQHTKALLAWLAICGFLFSALGQLDPKRLSRDVTTGRGATAGARLLVLKLLQGKMLAYQQTL
jgi:hypothetical protein